MSRAADLKWEFAEIPSGEYWMGASDGDEEASRDKKPRHRVRLSRSFELGRYPVTQAMWESVMVRNPSGFRGTSRPVENVSWYEVQEFLQELNGRNDGYLYRLPIKTL